MPGAIGHAVHRRIAAKTEILSAGRADRPAAAFVAEFEQRATMRACDRLFLKRLCVFVDGLQDLILQSGDGFPGALAGSLAGARFGPGRAARHLEAGKFADHRVAADADAGCDLAAGEAGFKMTLQQFDAIGGPGRYVRKHFLGSTFCMNRRVPKIPVRTPCRCRGSQAAHP